MRRVQILVLLFVACSSAAATEICQKNGVYTNLGCEQQTAPATPGSPEELYGPAPKWEDVRNYLAHVFPSLGDDVSLLGCGPRGFMARGWIIDCRWKTNQERFEHWFVFRDHAVTEMLPINRLDEKWYEEPKLKHKLAVDKGTDRAI